MQSSEGQGRLGEMAGQAMSLRCNTARDERLDARFAMAFSCARR